MSVPQCGIDLCAYAFLQLQLQLQLLLLLLQMCNVLGRSPSFYLADFRPMCGRRASRVPLPNFGGAVGVRRAYTPADASMHCVSATACAAAIPASSTERATVRPGVRAQAMLRSQHTFQISSGRSARQPRCK